MSDKILRWLIFSVVIALLPLAFNLLRFSSRGTPLSLLTILSNGELLLISAAIAAAAAGELFASGQNYIKAKLFAGGGCVIVLILASFLFADISVAIASGEKISQEAVSTNSIVIFILTVVASGSCVALSEV